MKLNDAIISVITEQDIHNVPHNVLKRIFTAGYTIEVKIYDDEDTLRVHNPKTHKFVNIRKNWIVTDTKARPISVINKIDFVNMLNTPFNYEWYDIVNSGHHDTLTQRKMKLLKDAKDKLKFCDDLINLTKERALKTRDKKKLSDLMDKLVAYGSSWHFYKESLKRIRKEVKG